MGARFFRRQAGGARRSARRKNRAPIFPAPLRRTLRSKPLVLDLVLQKRPDLADRIEKEKGRKCPKYALELRGDIS